eukprot:Cvel_33679.t1-p1 / transcript=Cvel_33679.t1 / gene=Cvel_33679 / organism=Chromera_velia_CCMP2878 / gene_product=hypothetical protein / transcript_product=hypothetical protein / location=Cvel_scaffold5542:405-4999(-) / protein_length=684 / sequence_SO=supercontig / SO=protein_coding / is_pseudo=false
MCDNTGSPTSTVTFDVIAPFSQSPSGNFVLSIMETQPDLNECDTGTDTNSVTPVCISEPLLSPGISFEAAAQNNVPEPGETFTVVVTPGTDAGYDLELKLPNGYVFANPLNDMDTCDGAVVNGPRTEVTCDNDDAASEVRFSVIAPLSIDPSGQFMVTITETQPANNDCDTGGAMTTVTPVCVPETFDGTVVSFEAAAQNNVPEPGETFTVKITPGTSAEYELQLTLPAGYEFANPFNAVNCQNEMITGDPTRVVCKNDNAAAMVFIDVVAPLSQSTSGDFEVLITETQPELNKCDTGEDDATVTPVCIPNNDAEPVEPVLQFNPSNPAPMTPFTVTVASGTSNSHKLTFEIPDGFSFVNSGIETGTCNNFMGTGRDPTRVVCKNDNAAAMVFIDVVAPLSQSTSGDFEVLITETQPELNKCDTGEDDATVTPVCTPNNDAEPVEPVLQFNPSNPAPMAPFTVTVASGTSNSHKLTFEIPDGFSFVSSGIETGTCSNFMGTGTIIMCTDASSETSFTVLVKSDEETDISGSGPFTVTVEENEPDMNICDTGTKSGAVTSICIPNSSASFTPTLTFSDDQPAVGETITASVNSDTEFEHKLTLTLPPTFSFASTNPAPAGCEGATFGSNGNQQTLMCTTTMDGPSVFDVDIVVGLDITEEFELEVMENDDDNNNCDTANITPPPF